MKRVIAILALASASAAAGSSLFACSDDDGRPTFTAEPGLDAAAVNLPDGGAPDDAAAAPDTKGPYDPTDEPVVCAVAPCAVELVAGRGHFCARFDDGTVRCWGNAAYGALGAADAGDAGDAGLAIHAVAGLSNVTQLSAAGATTCARVSDGRVFCWGQNSQGQLGLAVSPVIADEDPHPIPKLVALSGPATRVDVGESSACAVLASGALSCWGSNEQQELARPDSGPGPSPGEIRGPGVAAITPLTVSRASPATYTTLGLSTAGEVWSWGALSGGEGLVAGRVSSISPAREPERIAGLANVTSLVSSGWVLPPDTGGGGIDFPEDPSDAPQPHAHACALAGGEVRCWGRSDKGALCTGLPDPSPIPADAPILSRAWPQQLAVAEELTCARLTDGTVQCCGADGSGRLATGLGPAQLYSAYFQPAVGFDGHAVKVAAGDTAVCALVKIGAVECWGGNEHGELGGQTVDSLSHPSASAVAF